MPSRGRPKGSGNIPWASIIARLRETPDTWVLVPEMANVTGRTIHTIRMRERHALRLEDGVIRCKRTAGVVLEDNVYVTLYLKFETKKKGGPSGKATPGNHE